MCAICLVVYKIFTHDDTKNHVTCIILILMCSRFLQLTNLMAEDSLIILWIDHKINTNRKSHLSICRRPMLNSWELSMSCSTLRNMQCGDLKVNQKLLVEFSRLKDLKKQLNSRNTQIFSGLAFLHSQMA